MSHPPTALAGPHIDVYTLVPNLHLSAHSFSSRWARLCCQSSSLSPHHSSSSPDRCTNAKWVNSCETSVSEKSPYSPQTVFLHYTFFISITSLNKQSEFLVRIWLIARLGFSTDPAPFMKHSQHAVSKTAFLCDFGGKSLQACWSTTLQGDCLLVLTGSGWKINNVKLFPELLVCSTAGDRATICICLTSMSPSVM